MHLYLLGAEGAFENRPRPKAEIFNSTRGTYQMQWKPIFGRCYYILVRGPISLASLNNVHVVLSV